MIGTWHRHRPRVAGRAVAGVFSGIAASLNALVTSLLVPLAVTLLIP